MMHLLKMLEEELQCHFLQVELNEVSHVAVNNIIKWYLLHLIVWSILIDRNTRNTLSG